MAKATYAILHIPHSSRLIPAAYRGQFVLSDRALEKEKLRLTDSYVDEIFSIVRDEAATVAFPVSRLLVDPERILDDRREPMAQVGMGAIYTRRTDGGPMRRDLSRMERKKLLYKYYLPHHRTVGEAVERALGLPFGKALIIDCHSFPSSPLPCDPDQRPERPDICIGTDPFHTPGWLLETLVEAAGRSGYSCEINRPYSGTLVPDPYFRRNPSVFSIMLEVNRRLYMDEGTGRKKKGFRKLAGDIQDIVADLVRASCRSVFYL